MSEVDDILKTQFDQFFDGTLPGQPQDFGILPENMDIYGKWAENLKINLTIIQLDLWGGEVK